jgi:DNA polymerase eta
MDVTKVVNQRLMERFVDRMPESLEKLDSQECGVYIDWEKLGMVMESRQEEARRLDPGQQENSESSQNQSHWDTTTWRDLQLAMGAELAAEIRQEVFDTLHYSCSAGIAHYKVVAKLCSSKNKPNKQTVLRETARMDFMRDVPFKNIRNLGGKLGNEVGEDLEILNASEIWKYHVQDLQDKFGKSTGLYLYNISRGIDHEEGIYIQENCSKGKKTYLNI